MAQHTPAKPGVTSAEKTAGVSGSQQRMLGGEVVFVVVKRTTRDLGISHYLGSAVIVKLLLETC